MLSIIIPTLNEEEYLPILLSQIKKQNFSDYEIIVADAGSKDKTVEIAKSFGCTIVKGGLPAKGRNEGAKVAKGDLLLFMDADNIFLPDGFLEKLISEFKKRNLGVASFPIYPAGNWFDKIAYFLYNSWAKISQNFLPHATNSILIKKEIFEKVGGFDEEIKIGEDHDLARRAAKISKFGFIETKPVFTSARRFELEGRILTYGKYILAGIYMLFFGPIKRNIFLYRFDELKKKNNSNIIKRNMEEKLPAPRFQMENLKLPSPKPSKTPFLLILIIFFIGIFIGALVQKYQISPQKISISLPPSPSFPTPPYSPQTQHEALIIEAVKKASPAVVSIVVSKDLPVIEEYFEEWSPFGEPFFKFKIPYYRQRGTEKKEIAWGSGFFVSKDGLVVTNKHVVLEEDVEYTVITFNGEKFPAKVLAKDPVQDLAVLKVKAQKEFPFLTLGDSDKLELGQTVIAIGNALGEFQNTVSVGVISGLGRKIIASGGEFVEVLEDVIQTDAPINKGNSGGPLLNLKAEVVGINTAVALGGENIGFAIPINSVKKSIEQAKTLGKIVYPFLGVRYIIIDEKVQKENNLPVNYGAWIVKGKNDEPAIYPGSSAAKIGLKEGDIILEFNGEKITPNNSLAKIIKKYSPGDKVTLKILRGGQEKIFEVILGERTE